MTRTLITGASGFIGRHAVDAAAALGPVCALVRAEVDVPGADTLAVWDGSAPGLVSIFSEFEPGRVIHLAAAYRREHGVDDVSALVATNVGMTAMVMEAAAASTRPVVVLAGTAFQHFGRRRRPLNLYAATKLAAYEVAAYYGDAAGVPWAPVVLYDVYGPGMRRPTLIGRAVDAAGGGAPLAVPADDPIVAPLYVDDAVAALQAAAAGVADGAAQPGAEVFAVPPEFMPVSAVVATVTEVTGRPVAIADAPYPSPRRTIEQPVTGDRPPGWSAHVTLAAGLRRMLDA